MKAVEISHRIELGPELPEEVKKIAFEQGEDPDKVPGYLDEFRNLIYGKLNAMYITYILIDMINLF